MSDATAPPPVDLGAEAALGLGEWALVAVVAAGGLAYLVRGFARRRKSSCGGCAGCDKAGACPTVKLGERS
jgi:hypothetical protein